LISRNLDGFLVPILIEFGLFKFLFRTILLQICLFLISGSKMMDDQVFEQ